MNIQIKMYKFISVTFISMLLSCFALSVSAQQINPKRLAPCPKLDYSKDSDVGIGGRTEKWTNCWGRYQVELDKNEQGNVYEGEWQNGWVHGLGILTSPKGSKHVGEFKNGKRHGFITSIMLNGDKFLGEYKDGKRLGQGTYVWANGDKYVGEWTGGDRNGQGTFTFANGDKYVGEFKDDKYHGQGIGITTDGRRFEGIWENNNFIREAKVNLSGQNVQSTQTKQDSNTSDTSANSFGVEDAKVKCLELGFKTGTERYGKCVLELSR